MPTAGELPKDRYKHPSSVEDNTFIVPIHLLSGSPFLNSGNVIKGTGSEDSGKSHFLSMTKIALTSLIDVDMDGSAHADEDSDIEMMASAHHNGVAQRQSASPDLTSLREVTIATNEKPDRDTLERVTFPVERETMQGPLIRLVSVSKSNK